MPLHAAHLASIPIGSEDNEASQAVAGAVQMSSRQVIEQHAALVLRILGRMGVEDANVEDLAQEVFMAIHQKLAEFEGRSKLSTWIYSICLRKARDHRRRASTRRELPTAVIPDRSVEGNPQQDALNNEGVALLYRALDTLPLIDRQLLVLHEFEDVPVADAAQVVGCSRRTAYARLEAARARIQTFYRKHETARRRS
jgi:RNA polymerase sigma-70 factor (ECF subfamily)